MINNIILLLVGIYIGYKIHSFIADLIFKKLLKDLNLTVDDLKEMQGHVEPKSKSEYPELKIIVEKVGDVLYAYRKDNNLFLGQGADREALIEAIAQRVSNVRVVISEHEGAKFLTS